MSGEIDESIVAAPRVDGQMSLRKTSLPSASLPSASVSKSKSIEPGERVGDHERRRREVVHLHVGVMRPSKLRLPDSTAVTARSFVVDGAETSSMSGPELPMQVVQP
jgi:hypothetical protein